MLEITFLILSHFPQTRNPKVKLVIYLPNVYATFPRPIYKVTPEIIIVIILLFTSYCIISLY